LGLTEIDGRAQIREPEIRLSELRGSLVLDWDDTNSFALEVASDPAGPWATVPGAVPPFQTLPLREHRFWRLGPGSATNPGGGALTETFSARAESAMGRWYLLPQDDWMFTRGARWTHVRSGLHEQAPNYRSMSGHFLVPADNTPIAVFFSAEAYVELADKRLFLRALVDGTPLNPQDVVFATGTSPVNPESRAFVFTGRVGKGLHTVELQWLVDREGTGYIRDAAFLVRVGDSPNSDGSVQTATPPSGPTVSTTSGAWADVPGLSGAVQTKAGETLGICVSTESFVTGGGTMFLRALIDGQPAEPSDVLFAKGSAPQCRLVAFGKAGLPAGPHTLRIQWLANGGVGEAFMGDRSLVLTATPKNSGPIVQELVTPPSGPAVTTSSTTFTAMPGLSVTGKLPANGEVAVIFSAVTSVSDGGILRVRLTIDGQPVPDSDVQLAQSDLHTGAHSFVFSAKHLYPDGPPPASTIRVEWRVAIDGTASADDRTMLVLVKKPTVPDLAEPPLFGAGGNFPIESAIGSRRLLVILFDPGRPGHPAPSVASVVQGVLGNANSVKNYFSVVSSGKYSLNNALAGTSVLGWYTGTQPWDTYFGGGDGCDGYTFSGVPNGQDIRRREALERAAQDINFANFDDNGDGVLDPKLELAILLIIPDAVSGSLGKVRQVFDNNCGPLSVDGVLVPFIAEWLTDNPAGEYNVPAHELSHLLLGVDDMYVQDYTLHTEAGRLSLMEGLTTVATPHLDSFNKLALGWVSPTIVTTDGIHALQDVKKSGKVLILPRLPGKATDEFYLLENRQNPPDNALYDQFILDSGIAVWHIVHGQADNGLAPPCESNWATTGNGNARRGIRLLRPQIRQVDEWSLWTSADYNLLDTGLVCPQSGDNPADRRNVLRWADGTRSYFSIINWPANAETMSFQVVAP